MTRSNYFPQVKLGSGSVRVLGFWHGFPGYKPPESIKQTLGRQVQGFRPQDYLVIEGSPYEIGKSYEVYRGELTPVPAEGNLTVMQGTISKVSVEDFFPEEPNTMVESLSQIPGIKGTTANLDKRSELAEFYFSTLLWNPVDSRIRGFQMEHIDGDVERMVREWANITWVSPEEFREYTQANVGVLDGRIEGVSREKLELYFEKLHIGRSLLLARTAEYRAKALGSYPQGGEVELFLGCVHAGEALRFLKNPKAVERYLSIAHEEVRDVYGRNEDMQEEITEAFHNSVRGQKLRPVERTLTLKAIVDRAFEEFIGQISPEESRIIRL